MHTLRLVFRSNRLQWRSRKVVYGCDWLLLTHLALATSWITVIGKSHIVYSNPLVLLVMPPLLTPQLEAHHRPRGLTIWGLFEYRVASDQGNSEGFTCPLLSLLYPALRAWVSLSVQINVPCLTVFCGSLKPLDIEFMKQLHQKVRTHLYVSTGGLLWRSRSCQVNIIPVIAKADTFTPEECAAFKRTVGCL